MAAGGYEEVNTNDLIGGKWLNISTPPFFLNVFWMNMHVVEIHSCAAVWTPGVGACVCVCEMCVLAENITDDSSIRVKKNHLNIIMCNY